MKRPLMKVIYGTQIDLPLALVAETTLGAGSQVRDKFNQLWTRGATGWVVRGAADTAEMPRLCDLVQHHGDVTVVRILGSELQ